MLQQSSIQKSLVDVNLIIQEELDKQKNRILVLSPKWAREEINFKLHHMNKNFYFVNLDEIGFKDQMYPEVKFNSIILLYAFNYQPELMDKINYFVDILIEGGNLYIYSEEENISKYAATHFLNRFELSDKLKRYVQKKYRKIFNHIAVGRYFGIEVNYLKDVRYNFIKHVILYGKYPIKNFISFHFIIEKFFERDFTIVKRSSGFIFLRKYY